MNALMNSKKKKLGPKFIYNNIFILQFYIYG